MFRRQILSGFAAVGLALLLSTAARAEQAPVFTPTDDEHITVLGLQPMETLRFVNPRVNSIDAANQTEGWVHLRLTVAANGDVSNARVIDAFPKNLYEKAVMKVAPGWKFTSSVAGSEIDVGIAFYSELFESQASQSARGGHVRTVSKYNYTTLDNLIKDLVGTGNLDEARPRLEKLRKRYEGGDLTVTDIARYYAAMARFERLTGHYNTSLAAAHGALLLSRFLDNRKLIYGLHLEIMSSLLALNRNDDAIDYYDRWRSVSKIPMSKDGAEMMEDLRKRGAGKGHPFTIVDFDAAHHYERHHVKGRAYSTTLRSTTPSGSASDPSMNIDIEEPVLQTALELISFDFPASMADEQPVRPK